HRLELKPERQFLRSRLRLQSADGRFKLQAAALPAPLHLAWAILAARGLSWRDKYLLASLHWRLKKQQWKTPAGSTVLQWLRDNRQSDTLIAQVWNPLCIAALNTPTDLACAQLFAHVLRDSTGAQAWASDLLIPRTDLSDLWAEHIPQNIVVHTGRTVRSLLPEGNRWLVGDMPFDAVIVAGNVPAAGRLLSGLPVTDTSCEWLDQLGEFRFLPIATVTLQLNAVWRLPFPMLMLQEDFTRMHYGQWLFERSRFIATDNGNTMLSVVISNA